MAILTECIGVPGARVVEVSIDIPCVVLAFLLILTTFYRFRPSNVKERASIVSGVLRS